MKRIILNLDNYNAEMVSDVVIFKNRESYLQFLKDRDFILWLCGLEGRVTCVGREVNGLSIMQIIPDNGRVIDQAFRNELKDPKNPLIIRFDEE